MQSCGAGLASGVQFVGRGGWMAVRGAKNRSRPQRQKPPERPKALRRASLIEVAAANQDAAEKEKNAFAIFQDTASPIYRQKQDEKKDLEGDPENGVPGSAAKEFKRCRPIVEMMEHVFTEPPTTDHVLFGEMLFPRVPIDAQTGRRQVRLIKGCQGLTADAEPGRYIGKLDKKGNPKLTPLADIETAGGSMTEDDWKAAAETRMAIFRARLDHGNGPGWKDFWKIKNETDEVRALCITNAVERARPTVSVIHCLLITCLVVVRSASGA